MSEMMTDIEIYDRAVYAYLQQVSERVVYAPTNRAIELITRKDNFDDKTPWAFISYYRNPSFDIDSSRLNWTSTNLGDVTKVTTEDGNNRKAVYVLEFPVNLTYQVDIWAAKNCKAQELAINLMHRLVSSNAILYAPMNPDGEDGRFHLLDLNWVDNSDLEQESTIGRIYRHTITFLVDARIKLVRTKDKDRISCPPINLYEGDDW